MIKAVLKVNGSMLGTDSLVRLTVLTVPWPVSIPGKKIAKVKEGRLDIIPHKVLEEGVP